MVFNTNGTIEKNGVMAYIPQNAFLINATLRENIIFGNEYDREKYQKICKMCELNPDFAIL